MKVATQTTAILTVALFAQFANAADFKGYPIENRVSQGYGATPEEAVRNAVRDYQEEVDHEATLVNLGIGGAYPSPHGPGWECEAVMRPSRRPTEYSDVDGTTAAAAEEGALRRAVANYGEFDYVKHQTTKIGKHHYRCRLWINPPQNLPRN